MALGEKVQLSECDVRGWERSNQSCPRSLKSQRRVLFPPILTIAGAIDPISPGWARTAAFPPPMSTTGETAVVMSRAPKGNVSSEIVRRAESACRCGRAPAPEEIIRSPHAHALLRVVFACTRSVRLTEPIDMFNFVANMANLSKNRAFQRIRPNSILTGEWLGGRL